MCGVSGLVQFNQSSVDSLDKVKKMTLALKHRGPDGEGFWQDKDQGVTFGHRRLAIVDLSPTGSQPMVSPSGRFVVTFNGEIYNHNVLRERLKKLGVLFRGSSDTEVLTAALDHWGLKKTLDEISGMFAFALWDKQEKTIHLVRDRMGEKPLYYSLLNGTLAFASELKAFTALGWPLDIDSLAVTQFFKFSYIPAPLSIYKQVKKLTAGHVLSFSQEQIKNNLDVSSEPYWSLKTRVNQQEQNESDALIALKLHLKRVISQQMVADVPVGCFLSGGVDSSLIAATMQSLSSKPIKTFTIGFDDANFNEAPFAKKVAEHLETDHHELYLTNRECQDIIPSLSQVYDEPFADSSQIPTLLVAKMAKKFVTVCLSGDGGDELFAGYNRYVLIKQFGRKLKKIPQPLRKSLKPYLQSSNLANIFANTQFLLRASHRLAQAGNKWTKAVNILDAQDEWDIYSRLIRNWDQAEELTSIGSATEDPWQPLMANQYPSTANLQLADALTYLPDDILCKVDRAAMAVSLETRVPFLDHQLVEWAFSLPDDLKIRSGQGKWLLRQLLDQYVPNALIERPKMGFGIPIGEWLRGPLKVWLQDLLSESRLREQGLLNPEPIQKKLREHLSLKKDWSSQLWSAAVFQAWMDQHHLNL